MGITAEICDWRNGLQYKFTLQKIPNGPCLLFGSWLFSNSVRGRQHSDLIKRQSSIIALVRATVPVIAIPLAFRRTAASAVEATNGPAVQSLTWISPSPRLVFFAGKKIELSRGWF
jgi:hypothetical protein